MLALKVPLLGCCDFSLSQDDRHTSDGDAALFKGQQPTRFVLKYLRLRQSSLFLQILATAVIIRFR